MIFADSSAVVRAYLHDEVDHDDLRTLLLESDVEAVCSALVFVEVPTAFAAAGRARRLRSRALTRLLEQFARDTDDPGVISVIEFDGAPTLRRSQELVLRFPLGALDAMHLAVAERQGRQLAGADDLVFVTRDEGQRLAAEALGFQTA